MDMFIFEAIYTNTKTEERIVRTIDFSLAPSLTYQEAFQYSVNHAFEMQGEGEELYEVRNISC